MRGLKIDLPTTTGIDEMAMKGPGTQGTWKSIESLAKNHKMKYDINSRIPKDQNVGHLGYFLSNIKQLIFDRTLKNLDYIIGHHSLLKNDGIVEYDKKPHADYANTSRKT